MQFLDFKNPYIQICEAPVSVTEYRIKISFKVESLGLARVTSYDFGISTRTATAKTYIFGASENNPASWHLVPGTTTMLKLPEYMTGFSI